jgi:hypothetical protein
MWCQKLSAELGDVYCPLEPTRLLRTLDPYEHLRRFLRLCTTHFKRHVHDLRPSTTQKVRNAMLSLSSSQPHPNLEGAFQVIENGGRKAKGLSDSIPSQCFVTLIRSLVSMAEGQAGRKQICSPSSLSASESYSHRNLEIGPVYNEW